MRRGLSRHVTPLLLLASLSVPVFGEPAQPLASMARMPIREITVFKDGHAFVTHEGVMPTDGKGKVQLDALPHPVLGTFWTWSEEKDSKLLSVTANQRKVKVDHTAITLKDLIEANVGADVLVHENAMAANVAPPEAYAARILSRPTISGEELEETSPPNSGPRLPVKGEIVLLKTDRGTRVLPLDHIHHLTFVNDPKTDLAAEEFRNLLTLQFAWAGGKAPEKAAVGMAYVQRGIRWIPNYKVVLDDAGNAVVKLQATLINEMADLEDVTANLVVGVPSFAYAETMDPMALQQAAVQLSQYFQTAAGAGAMSQFSNGIQTQMARMGERQDFGGGQQAAERPMDLGPEVAGTGKAEDLFLYTVKHVTLPKGARMVMPVVEFTVPKKDVYTLDIPFAPPAPMVQHLNTEQQRELARLAVLPKVQHRIRLTNTSKYPLTTAPALLFAGEKLLAQTTMTYASPGAEVDLPMTTAVDVKVKKVDKETGRVPNAAEWNGSRFQRVELEGRITLTNYGKSPVELSVTRHVLGKVGEASDGGKAEMVNIFEDDAYEVIGQQSPYWYQWRYWPDWWARFNGVGRIKWTTTIEAGKAKELTYTWAYYWN